MVKRLLHTGRQYGRRYLWVLPFLAFIIGYYALDFLYQVELVPNPILVGKSLAEAVKIAGSSNLNLRILSTQVDQSLPPDTIITQTPNHPLIKADQHIFLVISQLPAAPLVLNLLDKSESEVKEILERLKLPAKIHYLPAGPATAKCLAQSPAANTPLEQRNLLIYCGICRSEPILVPNLVGYKFDQVQDFLTAHQIEVKTTHLPMANHMPGLILDQAPKPGTILKLEELKQFQLQISQ